jgi:hypothetical protein
MNTEKQHEEQNVLDALSPCSSVSSVVKQPFTSPAL